MNYDFLLSCGNAYTDFYKCQSINQSNKSLVTIMPSSTVNEILCLVSFYYDQLDNQSLHCKIVNFYTLDELTAAKKLLIAECAQIDITHGISDFKKRRLNTISEEAVKHKVTKDILDIWSVVDTQKGGVFETQFVATDIQRCLNGS